MNPLVRKMSALDKLSPDCGRRLWMAPYGEYVSKERTGLAYHNLEPVFYIPFFNFCCNFHCKLYKNIVSIRLFQCVCHD